MTIKVPNLAGSTSEFKIGDLISSIINFIVIALVVFVAYKAAFEIWYCRRQNQGRKEIRLSLYLVSLGLEHDPATYSGISINRQLSFRFHTGTDI